MGSKISPSYLKKAGKRVSGRKIKLSKKMADIVEDDEVAITNVDNVLEEEAIELGLNDDISFDYHPEKHMFSENDEDLEEGLEAAETGPKKKMKRNTSIQPEPVESKEILLIVPQGYTSDGWSQVTVLWDCKWEDVFAAIVVGMGCEKIVRKPVLRFKLDKPKAKNFNLSTAEDWEVLKNQVTDEEKRQAKSKQSAVKVDIIVSDEYMNPLRCRFVKGFTIPTCKGKQKISPLNLDVDSDEPAGDNPASGPLGPYVPGSDGFSDEERQAHSLILAKLRNCPGCPHGDAAFCLKSKDGAHVRFTSARVKGWAKALAKNVTGVSVELPPRTPSFEYFFTAAPGAIVHPPPDTPPLPPLMPQTIPTVSSPTPSLPTAACPTSPQLQPANSFIPASGSTSIDLSLLITTQLMNISQMQMQMFQAISVPRNGPYGVSYNAPGAMLSGLAPYAAPPFSVNGPFGEMGQLPHTVSPANSSHGVVPIIIDHNKLYPQVDEFLEPLLEREPKRRHILAKLVDCGLYRLDEVHLISDTILEGTGMVLGDIFWLRTKVEHALRKLQ
ncbi:hypothetical protein BU17DRAFT_63805 [Hysterangium stoloniferum]|nr:hypothetical protein BU17DRAFT_63805 [Hysterangium stoloniferum]